MSGRARVFVARGVVGSARLRRRVSRPHSSLLSTSNSLLVHNTEENGGNRRLRCPGAANYSQARGGYCLGSRQHSAKFLPLLTQTGTGVLCVVRGSGNIDRNVMDQAASREHTRAVQERAVVARKANNSVERQRIRQQRGRFDSCKVARQGAKAVAGARIEGRKE